MLLILEQDSNKIIGADKDFLESSSIKELNQKFSNLDAIKKEYSDYKIEEIPVKNYKLLFFSKKDEATNLGFDNLLLDDSLLNSETKPSTEPQNNSDENKTEDTLSLDNLLDDSLLNSETKPSTEPQNNSNENRTEDTLSFDNLLDDSLLNSETKPSTEPQNNSNENRPEDTLSLDNLLDDSLLNSETKPSTEPQNNSNENRPEDTDNTINIDSIMQKEINNTSLDNQEKTVIEINFDIDAIKRKKLKKD